MIGKASNIKVKFFELPKIQTLELKVNEFLKELGERDIDILDLKYESEKDEYGKHFTAMIIYKDDFF